MSLDALQGTASGPTTKNKQKGKYCIHKLHGACHLVKLNQIMKPFEFRKKTNTLHQPLKNYNSNNCLKIYHDDVMKK